MTVTDGSPDDGANMIFSQDDDSNSQRFYLRPAGDGSYALLTAVSGGKRCVDVYNISKDDGANLVQWEYWGGEGQKFILEPAEIRIKGDLNRDGKCDILDAILLQKWLLAIPDTHIADWKAGDLYENGRLDIFDLCLLKKMLIENK